MILKALEGSYFGPFWTSEHLLPWYLSHPTAPISSSKHLKAGSSLLNPICTPGGWLMANPLQEVPPRRDAQKKPDRGAKYKPEVLFAVIAVGTPLPKVTSGGGPPIPAAPALLL